MFELLAWVEGSALGSALRASGVWTYGLLNLAHILGIATLFGSVLMLDLRMLGAWRSSVPFVAIARPAVPLAGAGFVLAILSGVAMISFNATEYHANPFLYVKLPVIVLGVINVLVVQRLRAWRSAVAGDEPVDAAGRVQLAVAGGLSLLIWVTVLATGRMIGYW